MVEGAPRSPKSTILPSTKRVICIRLRNGLFTQTVYQPEFGDDSPTSRIAAAVVRPVGSCGISDTACTSEELHSSPKINGFVLLNGQMQFPKTRKSVARKENAVRALILD